MSVTTWFQDMLLFKESPSRSTLSTSSRVVPKKKRGGWLPSTSFLLEIVVDLHFAAPNRSFQTLAHFSISARSWLRESAARYLLILGVYEGHDGGIICIQDGFIDEVL